MKEIVVGLTQTGRKKLISCDKFQIFCFTKFIFMAHKRLLEKTITTNNSISFVCSVFQLKTQSEILNHVCGDEGLL